MKLKDLIKYAKSSEWEHSNKHPYTFKTYHLFLIGTAKNGRKIDVCLAGSAVIQDKDMNKKGIEKDNEDCARISMLHLLETSLKTRQGYKCHKGRFSIQNFELNHPYRYIGNTKPKTD